MKNIKIPPHVGVWSKLPLEQCISAFPDIVYPESQVTFVCCPEEIEPVGATAPFVIIGSGQDDSEMNHKHYIYRKYFIMNKIL